MPTSQKRLLSEIKIAGPCPDCGDKSVVRKFDGKGDGALGHVECGGECPYSKPFLEFRHEVQNIRRAANGYPPM